MNVNNEELIWALAMLAVQSMTRGHVICVTASLKTQFHLEQEYMGYVNCPVSRWVTMHIQYIMRGCVVQVGTDPVDEVGSKEQKRAMPSHDACKYCREGRAPCQTPDIPASPIVTTLFHRLIQDPDASE